MAARRAVRLLPHVLLAVLSFLQAPGRITFDTDLGLALDPGHLMSRAGHLWSAENGFGGVGDQTYGFLFPMGPFFWVFERLGLPVWVVQRLWCALVLLVAYEGARRLVGRVVTPSPAVAAVAGLAWALSPRMLTVVGQFSSEALPVAVLPWVLLPLVAYAEHDRRRAVALSGAAVLALGAVNASATLAVLPVPLLYLLTRPWTWRRRLGTTAWWGGAVVLATAWWVGPLLFLGAYSPPFIDWVESAGTSTSRTGALNTLRGATDWVAYVPESGHGFWPAGWSLATTTWLVLLTTVTGALGLAGLASRRVPERRWLLLTALSGFAVLTIGHAASPGSPFDATFRSLLDGPLVPFRNIYKFDSVLRLPLLLGFAHLLTRAPVRLRVPRAVPLVAGALVLLTAAPAFAGDLRPGPGFEQVPSWWQQAADRIAEDGHPGRTLVLPEATTGRYRWGRTIGEPLEALARSPWAVRNQVPLTAAGSTRVVDAVEAVLSSGRGSPALAAVLGRSGVGQVLVRNDLDEATAGSLPPVRVRAALQSSPGMRLVRSFGPQQAAPSGSGGAVDGGIGIGTAPLDLWEVSPDLVLGPHLTALDDAVAVTGGPEDLLPLLESGSIGPQATVLASQLTGPWSGPRVLADGLQRRERNFGRVHRALGPVLGPDDPYRQTRTAHDLLPDPDVPLTTAAYDGLVSVTASSSGTDPEAFGGAAVGSPPSAALDADAATYWRSAPLTRPEGQWLQVIRSSQSDATSVTLRLVANGLFGPVVRSVTVETDAGSRTQVVQPFETPQVIALPPGSWTRLRITISTVTGSPALGVVGIRELSLPSPAPTRTLVVPDELTPGGGAPALSFRTTEPVAPCLVVDGTTRCDAASAVPSEEPAAIDRTFVLPTTATYTMAGSVLPGQHGDRLLPAPTGVRATATSSLDNGLLTSAQNLVDGSAESWVANRADASPSVTLRWPEDQVLDGLTLTPSSIGASRPTRFHLVAPGGTRDAVLDSSGRGTFARLTTRTLTLTFSRVQAVPDVQSSDGLTTTLPLGIGEISAGTTTPPGVSASAPVVLPCGKGPTAYVDGVPHPTEVHGTVADVRRSQPLAWRACDEATLGPGRHRVRVAGTAALLVRSVAMAPTAATTAPAASRPLEVRSWGQVERSVQVGAGDSSLLVVPEAQSSGWHARLGGHELRAATVDGWQQAWVVPAGDGGTVTLEFTPDRSYRLSLLIGTALSMLLLLLCAIVLRRPARVVTAPRAVATAAPRSLLVTAGLGALTLAIGGPVCLAGLLAGALLIAVQRRTWAAVLSVASLLAAGVVVLLGSGPTFVRQDGHAVQALSLAAAGLLAALVLPRADVATARSDVDLAKLRAWAASQQPQLPGWPAPRPLTAPVRQLRQAAVCLLLVVTAFHQSPGLIGNDTKLDLTADPGAFLRRALDLWNPSAFFGVVQNQAYGYLWPMGPFHLLGNALGLPDWVTQRLWMGLLLVVAYLGVVRLAERFALGSDLTRALGALSYALAPRVLTEIGGNSSEILPMAVLPWVLVPLVGASRPRRAAMRSGVAVLCMGAVNATAVLAVLVLPALLLLPGLRDRAGRRLAAWWVVAVGLATAWWVGPLLLQGKYASDFLDYIETASTTTGTTSPSEVLRGTSHWLAYVSTGGEPWWRSGWTLVTNGGVVLNTAVLAALCLVGLSRKGMPAQRRLAMAAAVGLVAMSAAHAGPWEGPFVDPLRTALNGPLAPFRNVHKFAPLLALPFALGLVHLLGNRSRVLAGIAAVALVGGAVPAVAGQLVPAGGYQALPAWWQQTGEWLDRHDADGRALVLPARSFGEFVWGRPLDDPLQALTSTPWAVRDAVPLGSAGNARLLDALTARLDSGRGSAAVSEVLGRSGVSYLVVANDLNRRTSGTPRPVLVHQALHDSPGVELVASFGPPVSAGGTTPRNQVVDHGLDETYAAVEVYRVATAEARVATMATAEQWLVSGGPESLFQLADRGLLQGRAVQLVGDGSTGRTVLSDALRRREVSFGSVRDNASATLTATEALRRKQAVPDRLPVPGAAHLATARYAGGTPTASTSSSDAGSQVFQGPQYRPASAFDGDPSTGWVSGGLGGAAGQWLQLDLPAPVDPAGTTLTPLTGDLRLGALRTVRVTTDTGSRLTRLTGGTSLLATPPGPTRRIRVTVESLDRDGFGAVAGIAELTVQGVHISESVVLPHDQPTSSAPVVVLDRAPGARSACVRTRTVVGCAPYLARPGEDVASLDRTFALDRAVSAPISGTVRGVPGAALDTLLDKGSGLRAVTSSSFVDEPQQRPGALVDGTVSTGWVAAESDAAPFIDLSWPTPRRIDSVTLLQDVSLPASLPTRVAVETPAGTTTVALPVDGVIALHPVVTDHLEVRVLAQEQRASFEPDGSLHRLPVGLSEIQVDGPTTAPGPEVALPCGQGPPITVDGVPHATAVDGTRADLIAGRTLTLRLCPEGPLLLAAGDHHVVGAQTGGLQVESLTLGGDSAVPSPARDVQVQRWGSEHRTVEVGVGDEAYLVVHENISSGWRATLDGVALKARRIDGWQQAWVVPAGSGGTVRLDFTPGRAYHLELLAGALLVLLLLALALVPAGIVERTERARDPWPVALLVSAGVLLAVGGLTGVVILGVLAIGGRFLRLPTLAGVAMGVAGLLTAYAPWAGPRSPGAFSRPVQLCALVAVSAAAAAISARRSPSGASEPAPVAPPAEGSAPPPAG